MNSSGSLVPVTMPASWQHSLENIGFYEALWMLLRASLIYIIVSICSEWSYCSNLNDRLFWPFRALIVFCVCVFFSSESGNTADSTCAQRHCRQHLWRIDQITSDLLPESSGVSPSVSKPFPSFYSAARFISFCCNLILEKKKKWKYCLTWMSTLLPRCDGRNVGLLLDPVSGPKSPNGGSLHRADPPHVS